MNRTTLPPSLTSGPANPDKPDIRLEAVPRSLLDIMSEALYVLVLLKRGQMPTDAAAFTGKIKTVLDGIERGAIKLGIAGEDIYAAKYAYCAAIDEVVLGTPSPIRDTWEIQPLQLLLFGDHLAGEHFFSRLDELRAQGRPRLQALEVYYFLLLLGFEGKYRIEGPEKLGFLTARLGDEITYLKGQRSEFAPHWAPPDNVRHAIRRHAPVWLPVAVVGVLGLLGFVALKASLDRETSAALADYSEVVNLPPRAASVTITLP